MENKSSFIREVTLGDLWRIFVHRAWVIILAMIVVTGAYIAYDKLTYVPRYNSTATLYILKQQNEGGSQYYGQEYEDFTLALKVVNDCDHLLKSHAVLDTVIENLGLNMTYGSLRGSIRTSNPEDTRILEVTVEAATPELAKRIVDNVCDVGVSHVTEAMGFKQVNLYEYGILNKAPCNTTSVMSYAVLAAGVMVVVYAIYLLTFLFDDRLKTDEEIERALELTVIGDIPNADHSKNRKYGYYKYGKYGKYGYGKHSKYGYGQYGAYGAYGGAYGQPTEEELNEEIPEEGVEIKPAKKKSKKNRKEN